jgi:uncharacterized protein YndB with AHSA1/START domain
MIETDEAVRREIVVEVPPERAFELFTAEMTSWWPPAHLVITWQIGADWKFHADLITTVELRFEPVGEGQTRVRLEHRDFDAFGSDAAAMKGAAR